MKQPILSLAVGLLCLGAAAQNFNPTVEVTNTYEGSLRGIEKPALVMAVPDSVTRFDLHFDYAVSDNPYRGAYEFRPYMVHMRPQTGLMEKKRFFLRAGAGWTLHPELEAVYSPRTVKGLDLNFYARHNSYFGPYHHLNIQDTGKLLPDGTSWQGYRSSTRVGLDGTYGWKKGVLNFDIGYRHLMTRGETTRQQLNGGEATLSLRSTAPERRWLYELMLKGAADVIAAPGKSGSDIRVDADGAVGVRIEEGRQVLLGVNVQYDANSLTGISQALVAVTPQYRRVNGRSVVRIGVTAGAKEGFFQKGLLLFPDVYLSYAVIPEKLVAFASATGGKRINSYSLLGARNSFYPTNFGDVENTVERFHVAAGIRGGIASRLQLSLKAGLAMYANQVWDALQITDHKFGAIPAYQYLEGTQAYAQADVNWISDGFCAEGHLTAMHCYFPELYYDVLTPGATYLSIILPPLLQGHFRVSYLWKKRIQGGVSCAFATERDPLPGWVDLGVFAEMALTRRLTIWARGGNLLNQPVQRIPLIVEKGPAVTAGIQLSL